MKNTIWRNNKTGNYYEVIDIALHSETVEKIVMYKPVAEPDSVWVRPYDLFFQKFTKVEK